MVGMEKHVTVTGISKAGRRVTRTKIILPTMVGETQHQSQGGKTPVSEPNNPLLPESFDGNYYSLEALQHQNIQNYDQVVDKNNRVLGVLTRSRVMAALNDQLKACRVA